MPAPQRLVVDNDAFVLFSGAGLLDNVAERLGFSTDSVLRLPSLPYMLGRGKAFKDYPPDVKQRAQLDCDRFGVLEEKPDPVVHESLLGIDNIDDTDAVLYALLADHPEWNLLSGDRRAMQALCNEPSLAEIRAKVSGRVACVEMVLESMIKAHPCDSLAESFRPVRPISPIVRVIFSDGNALNFAACLEAASSYHSDIRTALIDGFLLQI